MVKEIENNVVKKTCTKCGAKKRLEDFHKHKGGALGVSACCKTCKKKKDATRRPGAFGGEKGRGDASAFAARQSMITKYGIDVVEVIENIGGY